MGTYVFCGLIFFILIILPLIVFLTPRQGKIAKILKYSAFGLFALGLFVVVWIIIAVLWTLHTA